jgi:hypothetical protein
MSTYTHDTFHYTNSSLDIFRASIYFYASTYDIWIPPHQHLPDVAQSGLGAP